jgi:hypothetical protein
MARSTFIAPILATAIAGCLAPADGGSTATPAARVVAGASQADRGRMGFASLQTAIDAAFADAGRRTGLPRTALELVSAQAVTWSDGSLGCPQPGMGYTQALVPGYRIRIRAPAQEFDYHGGTRGTLLLCPAGRAVDPVPSGPV